MAQQINRRLPISCEPCRARKIRCLPPTDSTGPCASCIRRGLSPSQCVYLRYMHGRGASARQRETPSSVSTTSNDELLDRLRALEELVRSQGRAEADGTTGVVKGNQMPITPSTEASPSTSSLPGAPAPAGLLRTSVGGYQRFEPHGSMWNSVLHASQSAGGSGLEDDADMSAVDMPFDLGTGTTTDELIAQLPPQGQCEELKNVFLDVFAPLFHVLHNPTFEAQYVEFQRNPATMPLSWLALLYAILAVAVTSLDESSTLLFDLARKHTRSQCITYLASRYRRLAMQCLQSDQFLWRHTMWTLQALIFLIYGINHTHGRTWPLLGTTLNIAIALGCHVDPESFQLTIIEQEERRRGWAAVMMLHTIQMTSMGCLDQRTISHNAKLPVDADDSDIAQVLNQPSHGQRPTEMSYILHKFRLYEICAKICRSVFGTVRPTYDLINSIDQEIYQEQNRWESCYSTSGQPHELPVHHKVHLNILYGYSHQLTLLLHRPVIIRATDQLEMSLAEINNSRIRCVESARSLLQIHELLFQSTDFASFRWYNEGLGSFHAFHAFVVLVALLTTMEDTMQIFEIKEMLKRSFSVFEALTERSRICSKAVPILRYLLTTCEDVPVRQQQRYGTYENSVENNMSFEAMLKSLEPQQWLSPSNMIWNDWDFVVTNG